MRCIRLNVKRGISSRLVKLEQFYKDDDDLRRVKIN